MKDFEKFVVEKLIKIEGDISALKVKAGLWGCIAGLVSSAVLVLGAFLK